MKVLAVDWGRVRIGLAVSDDLGLTAHGLGVLPRAGEAEILDAIAARAHDLGVDAVVVGLPRSMDGTDGPAARAARAFAQALKDRVELPVHLWDERLTTRAAERMLVDAGIRRRARRDRVDQVAATLILQSFLDRQRSAAGQEGP